MNIYKNTNIANLPDEEWKDVGGYEGHYEISNLGRVKSLKRRVPHRRSGYITMPTRMLSQKISKYGYAVVNLCKDGIHSMKMVHILVAKAYIDNSNNYPQVNHKKGVTLDNRVSELEWVTPSQNVLHSFRVLKRKPTPIYGDKNPNAKKIVCATLGIKFNTINDASSKLGIHQSGISRICNGHLLQINGLNFNFI